MKTDFSDSTFFKLLSSEKEEIEKLKWIESEKANMDIGIDRAITLWCNQYRKKWLKNINN